MVVEEGDILSLLLNATIKYIKRKKQGSKAPAQNLEHMPKITEVFTNKKRTKKMINSPKQFGSEMTGESFIGAHLDSQMKGYHIGLKSR